MAYPTNSWSILPATQALLNKTKCTMEEAMEVYGSEGREGTILVCERDNGYGKKPTVIFLSSCSNMDMPVGTVHKAHHDQNLRPYGELTVKAVIVYTMMNKQPVCTVPSPLTLDFKAPLFCFK